MLIEDRIYRLIKLLLYTAKEENTDVTPTKLQKIFFLLEKEKGIQLGLDFKPWFFGAYSSKLQDYVHKLIESGEVDVEEEEVRDPLSGAIIGYIRNYVLTLLGLRGRKSPSVRWGMDSPLTETFYSYQKIDITIRYRLERGSHSVYALEVLRKYVESQGKE